MALLVLGLGLPAVALRREGEREKQAEFYNGKMSVSTANECAARGLSKLSYFAKALSLGFPPDKRYATRSSSSSLLSALMRPGGIMLMG